MPIYDYICSKCKKIKKIDRLISAKEVFPKCCGKKMNRIYGFSGVVWKCSGRGG